MNPLFQEGLRLVLAGRVASQVRPKTATGASSGREILRITVPKLINTYISGTPFSVYRNPTFLIHHKKLAPLMYVWVGRSSSIDRCGAQNQL